MPRAKRIFTIGHSTRSAEEFVEMLKAHGVQVLADVRSIPGSRKFPWFGAEEMAKWLPAAGIEYLPFKDLGGRRRARKESVNMGWRNTSFRGYADYMQTSDFQDGLERLMKLARQKRVAIMCAEAVPWRCHRSLIADALVIRGWKVCDIMSLATAREHKLTSFARVKGMTLSYPAEATLFRGNQDAEGTASE